MSSRKRKPADLRALCGEVGPDDGVNPREWNRDARRRDGRKLRQLCSQIARALQLALGGIPEAEAFARAVVREVRPAACAGRLVVWIEVPDVVALAEARAALALRAGRLRTEIAEAIHRRRAPELVFDVVVRRAGDDD